VSKPLFNISNDALQQGLDTVFSDPGFGKKNQEFINEFRHNAAVFAAFKNPPPNGEIVPCCMTRTATCARFREFKKLAQRVSRISNENWLQTEYNTAVRAPGTAVNFAGVARNRTPVPEPRVRGKHGRAPACLAT